MVSPLVIIHSTLHLICTSAESLQETGWGETSLSSVTLEEPARNSLCCLVKLAKKRNPTLLLGKRAAKEENQVC